MTIKKGHWNSQNDFDPETLYGFIYEIIDNTNGNKYIGKKAFHRWNKTGRKKLGNSNWEKYTSSSKELNDKIKTLGIHSFTFNILFTCCTKSCWSYSESNLLHKSDAMTLRKEDGNRIYLNKAILAVRWIPKHCKAIECINELTNGKEK
jgi:hypothetical protein